jgi:hypothetical protein
MTTQDNPTLSVKDIFKVVLSSLFSMNQQERASIALIMTLSIATIIICAAGATVAYFALSAGSLAIKVASTIAAFVIAVLFSLTTAWKHHGRSSDFFPFGLSIIACIITAILIPIISWRFDQWEWSSNFIYAALALVITHGVLSLIVRFEDRYNAALEKHTPKPENKDGIDLSVSPEVREHWAKEHQERDDAVESIFPEWIHDTSEVKGFFTKIETTELRKNAFLCYLAIKNSFPSQATFEKWLKKEKEKAKAEVRDSIIYGSYKVLLWPKDKDNSAVPGNPMPGGLDS